MWLVSKYIVVYLRRVKRCIRAGSVKPSWTKRLRINELCCLLSAVWRTWALQMLPGIKAAEGMEKPAFPNLGCLPNPSRLFLEPSASGARPFVWLWDVWRKFWKGGLCVSFGKRTCFFNKWVLVSSGVFKQDVHWDVMELKLLRCLLRDGLLC